MDSTAKKAAIAAYKERKPPAGIYAIRCAASGEIWVGQWSNLETIQNRLWFALRLGTSPHPSLQKSWHRHGEAQFQFEVLEKLEETDSPYVRDASLKERVAHWRSALKAQAV